VIFHKTWDGETDGSAGVDLCLGSCDANGGWDLTWETGAWTGVAGELVQYNSYCLNLKLWEAILRLCVLVWLACRLGLVLHLGPLWIL